jgi:hypothetical protein
MSMLSSWKNEQVTTMAKLTEEVAIVRNQCTEIHNTNTVIQNSITSMKAQYEDVKNKIQSLEIHRSKTEENINVLKSQIEEVHQLSRSSSMEIRNVPSKEKETQLDLISLVQRLGMTLNMTIKDQDIRDIYRRPGKPGTTRAIVAEFTSVQIKNTLLSSVKTWNKSKLGPEKLNLGHIGMIGDQRPIYVDEHLPYSSRKLFFRTREFAKKYNFKFCWISHGRVLLRKDQNDNYVHIKSENCLLKLSETLLC